MSIFFGSTKKTILFRGALDFNYTLFATIFNHTHLYNVYMEKASPYMKSLFSKKSYVEGYGCEHLSNKQFQKNISQQNFRINV